MKEKVLQMVDAYWKFDEAQQPMSSWHDKQDLLKALEELLQPPVIKSVCDCPEKDDCAGYGAVGERACNACQKNKQTVL